MHVSTYKIHFVILSVFCVQLNAYYETHHLESFCNSKDDEGEIHIPAWGAIILKLGHSSDYELTPAGTRTAVKIDHCTIDIEAAEGFSLGLVIEDMNIRGIKDRTRTEIQCSDYLMFSTAGKFKDLINDFLPFDPLNSKESKKICGKTHNARDNIRDFRGPGNIFKTKNDNLKIVFSQNLNPYSYVNNSFTLIITTYKRSIYSCEGHLWCSNVEPYCINEAFKCDNHLNCAFAGTGATDDEDQCVVEDTSSLLSSTTVIIILACLSGVPLLLCYLCFRKSKRQSLSEYPMDNMNSIQPTMRQQSLPMYEAVIALHTDDSDNIGKEPTPADPNDVPPSYDQLFPDGHPKEKEGLEETTTVGTTTYDQTPTTESGEENPKPPVIGVENV